MHSGSVAQLKQLTRKSLTGAYLSGTKQIDMPDAAARPATATR